MRSKAFVVLLVVALGVGACGGDPPAPDERVAGQESPGTSSETASGDKKTGGSDDKSGSSKGAGKKGGSADEPAGSAGGGDGQGAGGDGDANGGAGGEGSGSGDGSAEPSEGPSGGGGSAPRGGGGKGGSPLAPAAGSYVYRQSGYEEFCSASCDKQELPPRQTIRSSWQQRSASSATVVTVARSSRGRSARTTTRYTDDVAAVTEVNVRFSYSGYTFEDTYRPQPAVESLRFPLRPGSAWSGSWKGKVSGDYSVSVIGRETVVAAGREIMATKVNTKTVFRGDFEGRANATLWIDPRTKAIVRTAGNLRVKSTYGSYETGFATALTSGPNY